MAAGSCHFDDLGTAGMAAVIAADVRPLSVPPSVNDFKLSHPRKPKKPPSRIVRTARTELLFYCPCSLRKSVSVSTHWYCTNLTPLAAQIVSRVHDSAWSIVAVRVLVGKVGLDEEQRAVWKGSWTDSKNFFVIAYPLHPTSHSPGCRKRVPSPSSTSLQQLG